MGCKDTLIFARIIMVGKKTFSRLFVSVFLWNFRSFYVVYQFNLTFYLFGCILKFAKAFAKRSGYFRNVFTPNSMSTAITIKIISVPPLNSSIALLFNGVNVVKKNPADYLSAGLKYFDNAKLASISYWMLLYWHV